MTFSFTSDYIAGAITNLPDTGTLFSGFSRNKGILFGIGNLFCPISDLLCASITQSACLPFDFRI